MSEAASGFWLVPIPWYRGACYLCASAIALVAGACSRNPWLVRATCCLVVADVVCISEGLFR
jgi:hypothetical protein